MHRYLGFTCSASNEETEVEVEFSGVLGLRGGEIPALQPLNDAWQQSRLERFAGAAMRGIPEVVLFTNGCGMRARGCAAHRKNS